MSMRAYVIGSLVGHLLLSLVGAVLTQVLREAPPSANLIRVGLVQMERPAPQVVEPEPVREIQPPEPVVEAKPPKPIPQPPAELKRPELPVKPETLPSETKAEPIELHPPAEDLRPAPQMERVPTPPPTDIDFPEPEAVQKPVMPNAEQSVTEAEEVAPGAQVQATATAGVDDTYLRLVQQKIGRRWQPTPASAAGRAGVRVALRFRVLGSGSIADVTVVSSSGLSVFDRQARSAVAGANPLPAPPSRFGGEGIEIVFHFVYNP